MTDWTTEFQGLKLVVFSRYPGKFEATVYDPEGTPYDGVAQPDLLSAKYHACEIASRILNVSAERISNAVSANWKAQFLTNNSQA